MSRKLIVLFAVVTALTVMAASRSAAHPGHEHKILGTVTMAAADHVMLKDKDNKDVTVYLTAETKVVRDKKPMKVDDIKAGLRVVVTATTITENKVEKMVATLVELGAAQSGR